MQRLLALSLVALSLSATIAAQELPVAERTVSSQPAPGKVAGTFRYNVTFQTRSFDLSGFRDAIHTGQPATVVAGIVRELEAKARADQAAFRREIEHLGGRLDQQFWLINACTIEVRPVYVF